MGRASAYYLRLTHKDSNLYEEAIQAYYDVSLCTVWKNNESFNKDISCWNPAARSFSTYQVRVSTSQLYFHTQFTHAVLISTIDKPSPLGRAIGTFLGKLTQ
jgi:hypothetical protein